jgi:YVTN family beta-propeller protein
MTTHLYSTDTDAGTITVIDPLHGGKAIAVIPVGNGPRGAVKFTKDGRGFVSNSCGDTVSEIDALSKREVAKIRVGFAPTGVGIVPGDKFLLASNSGSNDVSIVDLQQRKEVIRVAVGREPKHMAILPSGEFAYVAVFGSDYVAKIDLRGLVKSDLNPDDISEVARIAVGDKAFPYSVALHPDLKLAFVANNQVPYISVIDLASDKVVKKIDVGVKGLRGVSFTPDGRRALATLENTSELAIVDVASLKVVGRVPTGPGPRGLVTLPVEGGYQVYIADFWRGLVSTSPLVGDTFARPHNISVVSLTENSFQAMAEGRAELPGVKISAISVGAGPCSVSVFSI